MPPPADLLSPNSRAPHESLGIKRTIMIINWWNSIKKSGRASSKATQSDVDRARQLQLAGASAAPAESVHSRTLFRRRQKMNLAVSHCIGAGGLPPMYSVKGEKLYLSQQWATQAQLPWRNACKDIGACSSRSRYVGLNGTTEAVTRQQLEHITDLYVAGSARAGRALSVADAWMDLQQHYYPVPRRLVKDAMQKHRGDRSAKSASAATKRSRPEILHGHASATRGAGQPPDKRRAGANARVSDPGVRRWLGMSMPQIIKACSQDPDAFADLLSAVVARLSFDDTLRVLCRAVTTCADRLADTRHNAVPEPVDASGLHEYVMSCAAQQRGQAVNIDADVDSDYNKLHAMCGHSAQAKSIVYESHQELKCSLTQLLLAIDGSSIADHLAEHVRSHGETPMHKNAAFYLHVSCDREAGCPSLTATTCAYRRRCETSSARRWQRSASATAATCTTV